MTSIIIAIAWKVDILSVVVVTAKTTGDDSSKQVVGQIQIYIGVRKLWDMAS